MSIILEWQIDGTPAENLQGQMPVLVRAFFAAGRAALHEGLPLAELHELRLEAKLVRYTLDLLNPLYEGRIQPQRKQVKQLQDYLGAVNDRLTAVTLLKHRGLGKAERRALKAELLQEAAEQAAAFRRFWREEFDTPDAEERWIEALGRTGI